MGRASLVSFYALSSDGHADVDFAVLDGGDGGWRANFFCLFRFAFLPRLLLSFLCVCTEASTPLFIAGGGADATFLAIAAADAKVVAVATTVVVVAVAVMDKSAGLAGELAREVFGD